MTHGNCFKTCMHPCISLIRLVQSAVYHSYMIRLFKRTSRKMAILLFELNVIIYRIKDDFAGEVAYQRISERRLKEYIPRKQTCRSFCLHANWPRKLGQDVLCHVNL